MVSPYIFFTHGVLQNPPSVRGNKRQEYVMVSRGGGVHDILRIRVCADGMGGFLGPKFSEQGRTRIPLSASMVLWSANHF